LYVVDFAPFAESDEWFEAFGPVLVVHREDTKDKVRSWHTRLVSYEDGTKIDFGVGHVEALKEDCNAASLPDHFDVGYEVLLDKDGVASSLKSPTFKAHIPAVPTESEYVSLINDFWAESVYVAKHLWRDDLLPAKYNLDYMLKHNMLRKMLEWSIEIDRNWSWKPGAYGKGLKKVLDSETYNELASTYAGGDLKELWEALFRTTALFGKIAIKVAAGLGYEYLHDLDKRVTLYLRTVERLDRQTTDREELARRLREGYALLRG